MSDDRKISGCWMVIWKTGAVWNIEEIHATYDEDMDCFEFDPEDVERLQEIIKEDYGAKIDAGKLADLTMDTDNGWHEDMQIALGHIEPETISSVTDILRFKYCEAEMLVNYVEIEED